MNRVLTIDEKIKKGLEFLEENSALFSKVEYNLIKAYLISGEFDRLVYLPDMVRQIIDELGMLKEEQDIYGGFLKIFSESFSLKDKEIIEIGGGVFPRLGNRLVDNYEIRKISIYDSRISPYISDNDRLKLIRRKVLIGEDDLGGDIIIGFMPCNGAEVILDQAINYQHDFMITLCGCGNDSKFKSEDEWINYLIDMANMGINKNNMGILKTKSLKQYGLKYPVIYNERN